MVPALKRGSSPPANPKLIQSRRSRIYEITSGDRRQGAPHAADGEQRSVAQENKPSRRRPPAPGCLPPLRRAATTPTPFNDRFRDASVCGTPPAPKREIRGIPVISQIEHTRKAGRREARVAPQPIRMLCAHQNSAAAPRGVLIGPRRGE